MWWELPFTKIYIVTYLLLVGIEKDVMRLPHFTKCAMSLTNCWSYVWKDVMRLPLRKCAITHLLLVIGKDMVRLPFRNVQCHSLPVGHMKQCDETAFQRLCNVTHLLLVIHRKRCDETAIQTMYNVPHLLLVIGKDVIRLPFRKCAMLLTSCWPSWKICDETAFQQMCFVQCHSQTVGGKLKMWWDCLCNVTHSLLKMWWDWLSQTVQCHSLAVGHGKRGDVTPLHKMWKVTHKLLVIKKYVMRLPFATCAMSHTNCWWRFWWATATFHQMFHIAHKLLVIENMWWDCLPQNPSMSLTSCWS